MKLLTLSLAGLLVVGAATMLKLDDSKSKTQIVVLNARIWTGDVDNPWAEAIASSGDTITYVGSNDGAVVSDGSTVIDAEGRLVVPGFIDAHVHFLTGGANLSSVQLRDARTPRSTDRGGWPRQIRSDTGDPGIGPQTTDLARVAS